MVGESGTGRNDKKYHYYKCSNAKHKNGCRWHTVRKAEIEDVILSKTVSYVFDKDIINVIIERVLNWQEKENTTISLLQKQLADVEKALANIMAAIEQGIINPTTKGRMDELTAQKTELEVKIAREEIQNQILTKDQIEFWLSKMITLDLANPDNRQRIIDTFVNSIYIYDDRAVINFNCREESETVPLQLSTYVSDLQGLGEPTI